MKGVKVATSATKMVVNIAWRSFRLRADTNMPAASEKKIVFNNTSADCHSSLAVTPPSWTGKEMTGRMASSA